MDLHQSDAENRIRDSESSDDEQDGGPAQGYISSANSTPPPPTAADSDRWQYHIDFQTFTNDLQAAANAVFPNETKSRYSKVSVLMLSWADEDPRLPVSLEMDLLYELFHDTYHYETERWAIPDENCHYKLTGKIMDFVKPEEDSKAHLKIVYYAGHARLLETRQLVWTSWRNNRKAKCPIAKWGGIQTILEEAPNDVLILLDCCASGTANASEGNGVNELISACAFNEIANGVGPYSFTSALVTELRLLSPRPSFSVGELYKRIFFRTQCRMPEELYDDGTERERHPAPIHLVLTQAGPVPRGIQLPARTGPQYPREPVASVKIQPLVNIHESSSISEATEASIRGAAMSIPSEGNNLRPSSTSLQIAQQSPLGMRTPRLLFAVRLRDTFKPGEDMVDHFTEWIRNFPTIADEMKVESVFDSLSTLVVMSLPISVSAYLPRDPAIISLGPITAENRISLKGKGETSKTKSVSQVGTNHGLESVRNLLDRFNHQTKRLLSPTNSSDRRPGKSTPRALPLLETASAEQMRFIAQFLELCEKNRKAGMPTTQTEIWDLIAGLRLFDTQSAVKNGKDPERGTPAPSSSPQFLLDTPSPLTSPGSEELSVLERSISTPLPGDHRLPSQPPPTPKRPALYRNTSSFRRTILKSYHAERETITTEVEFITDPTEPQETS